MLAGGLLANVGYALQPIVDENRIPTTYPVVAADDLTQRKPAKWIVRTGWTTSQPMHPFGEWVPRHSVQEGGHDRHGLRLRLGAVGGFQRTFEENGGQIVQKIWAPLDTNDFAPFLAQIRRDADAVFALIVAAPRAAVPEAVPGGRAQGKCRSSAAAPPPTSRCCPRWATRRSAAITPLHYSAALDTPANQRFAKAFEAKAGKVPVYYSEASYTRRRWIVEAIKAVGGKVEDREKLLAALRRSRSRTRRADRSRWTPTATPSRTSTCARSRGWTASSGTP